MIRPEELKRHLAGQLAPVYLIGGEEPLFVQDAQDAVRTAARKAGCDERILLDVETGFEWGRLAEAAVSRSLFGERNLIELRMPTGKPGTAGSRAIVEYCKSPSQDAVLMINTGNLDAGQRRSAWASAVDKAGVFVYAWPLPLAQLPRWIDQRLRAVGLSVPSAALELLVERSEGNLLAVAQEVDKLRLLFGASELSVEQVREAVADSARYTVYDLADAALAGNIGRCVRILHGLREEGVEPTLVLWALARDLRLLTALAERSSTAELFRRERVFQSRQAALQRAARAAPAPTWRRLLLRAARADQVIKGVAEGRPWDELIQLSTAFARLVGRNRAGSASQRPVTGNG